MGFSWPILVVMLVLGVLQLGLGVALGRCLPIGRIVGRGKSDGDRQRETRRLRYFADRLSTMINGLAGDVGEHRQQITTVNRDLATASPAEGESLAEFVLRSMARIIEVNDRLQTRLSATEARLQRQNEQLHTHFTEARTDALTGLMNRRALDDALNGQMSSYLSGHGGFALVMIDVDYFKNLNDQFGHPAGDDVLRTLATQLEDLLAGSGMVARYGGEEFAALISCDRPDIAQAAVEKIRAAVAGRSFQCEGQPLTMTVSLGLSMADRSDEDGFDVLKRADEALYMAKRAGRNCAYFHDGVGCRRIGGGPPASPAGHSNPAASGAFDGESDTEGESIENIYAAVREQLERVTELSGGPSSTDDDARASAAPPR